jgi:hypothetical protein
MANIESKIENAIETKLKNLQIDGLIISISKMALNPQAYKPVSEKEILISYSNSYYGQPINDTGSVLTRTLRFSVVIYLQGINRGSVIYDNIFDRLIIALMNFEANDNPKVRLRFIGDSSIPPESKNEIEIINVILETNQLYFNGNY